MKCRSSRLVPSLAVLACLLFNQCAQVPAQQADRSPVELGWHVVSREPLTYCPPGHSLPSSNRQSRRTFISLADGQTRFYIPPGNTALLNQAMAWREASLEEKKRQAPGWIKAGRAVAAGPVAVAKYSLLGVLFTIGAAAQAKGG